MKLSTSHKLKWVSKDGEERQEAFNLQQRKKKDSNNWIVSFNFG
jgi:hypothetical protein